MAHRGPSPALVISCLALFAALGGVSVAEDGVAAAKKLITGKQVKDNSLTGRDVKDGSLLAKDFRKGTLPAGTAGAKGESGRTGPTGPKGNTGTLDTSNFYDKAASDDRFLPKTGLAADSDLLDGLNSTAFLLADGKAADAETLDGTDSRGFVNGYGIQSSDNSIKSSYTAVYSHRISSNDPRRVLLTIPGFGTIEMNCGISDSGPAPPVSSVRFHNASGGQLAVFGDDGGADPGYVVLQDGQATSYTAERTFDHIVFQIGRGDFYDPPRTATVEITTVATTVHNFRDDCHGAAQAIAQTP